MCASALSCDHFGARTVAISVAPSVSSTHSGLMCLRNPSRSGGDAYVTGTGTSTGLARRAQGSYAVRFRILGAGSTKRSAVRSAVATDEPAKERLWLSKCSAQPMITSTRTRATSAQSRLHGWSDESPSWGVKGRAVTARGARDNSLGDETFVCGAAASAAELRLDHHPLGW